MLNTITALHEADKDPLFIINMGMFSGPEPLTGKCMGCAATAYMIYHERMSHNFMLFEHKLTETEMAIDAIRYGDTHSFSHIYCEESLPDEWVNKWQGKWCMMTHNWKADAPIMKEAALELQQLGY